MAERRATACAEAALRPVVCVARRARRHRLTTVDGRASMPAHSNLGNQLLTKFAFRGRRRDPTGAMMGAPLSRTTPGGGQKMIT